MPHEISQLNVLVVEDQPVAKRLIVAILKELKVNQIYTAGDGREAQEFLDASQEMVDLIICDWNMPRMTGLELLQQVRTVYPDMYFMMMTSKNDITSVKTARRYGVDAYIAKPYSFNQVKIKFNVLIRNMQEADSK